MSLHRNRAERSHLGFSIVTFVSLLPYPRHPTPRTETPRGSDYFLTPVKGPYDLAYSRLS